MEIPQKRKMLVALAPDFREIGPSYRNESEANKNAARGDERRCHMFVRPEALV